MKILVVGAGRFGREHLSRLTKEGIELIVSDIATDVARMAAHDFNAAAWGQDPIILMDKYMPDGCIIATSTASHVALAQACLLRNIPVLLEKPVATTAAEALILQQTEATSRAFVLPGHVLRFSKSHQAVSSIIRAGDIGKVLSVHSRRYRNDDHAHHYAELVPILMTMIHDIDLALWFSGGEAISAYALRRPPELNRSATFATLKDNKGGVWQLATAWTFPGNITSSDRVEILGSYGAIELDVGRSISVYSNQIRVISIDEEDPLTLEVKAFLSAVKDGVPPIEVGLTDAIQGLKAAGLIMRSLAQKDEPTCG